MKDKSCEGNPLYDSDKRVIQERRERLLDACRRFKAKYEGRTGNRLTYSAMALEMGLVEGPYSRKLKKEGERVSGWLRHPETIDGDSLERLCGLLGVSSEWVIAGSVKRRGMKPSLWIPTNEVSDRYNSDTASRAYERLNVEQQKAITVLIGSILDGCNNEHSSDIRILKLEELVKEAQDIIRTLSHLIECGEFEQEDMPNSDFIRRYHNWWDASEGILYEDEFAVAQLDAQIEEWESQHPVEELARENEALQRSIFPKGGSSSRSESSGEGEE